MLSASLLLMRLMRPRLCIVRAASHSIRQLAVGTLVIALLASLAADGSSSAVGAAAGGPRILYASDWSGHTQIYAVDPTRRAEPAQLTFGRGEAFHPVPSPNGRRVAYLVADVFEARAPALRSGGALWVARANGSSARRLASDGVGERVTWSPDSSRLAYTRKGVLHIVGTDGSGDRVVRRAPPWADTNLSPNGRWVATRTLTAQATVLEVSSRSTETTFRFELERVTPDDYGTSDEAAWSPDSRYVAFASARGVWTVEVRRGRLRRLSREPGFSLSWALDSRSLALVRGRGPLPDANFESGDLLQITLAGRVTSVVDDDRAYGGTIVDVAWTRPPAEVRYRAPEAGPATRVASDGLLADGPIHRLAADGERVAFNACDDVYTWTPASGEVVPLGQSGPLSWCRSENNTVVHSLAVAGDRVAYGKRSGCNSITISLHLEVFAPVRRSSQLARGLSNCASPNRPGVHRLTGAGGLLVFSTLHEPFPEPGERCCRTTLEEINRVGPDGCPCPVIASSPGPLAPSDVERDRVVAFGDNATLVLDPHGKELVSIPVSPVAAQLWGDDLVLLERGRLRIHDAEAGAFLRSWPLPDVPSGGTCDLQCVRAGDTARLRLHDLARGLVAYVLDGEVKLLRLADGANATVGRGTIARFLDAGLVYADGSRLHLVPFERLPLSGA